MKRRRPPQKSQIPRQEVIKLKIDPAILRQNLVLPKVEYYIAAEAVSENVFTGKLTPMPTVLVYFLTHPELKLVTFIMEHTNDYGECTYTLMDMAKLLRVSTPSLTSAAATLRRMGLLQETPDPLKKRHAKLRMINYKAIQHLNDLLEGEPLTIYPRIRKATLKQDITHLTKEDIDYAHDQYALPPNHDPEEEEEYD